MKKIYFSLVLLAFAFQNVKAQLSLTKTANEPVLGDVYSKQSYDTITVVPKNTGTAQLWSFASWTATSFVETSTYTTVASTPSAASFPNATLAETMSGTGSSITYFKSTPTTFEFQGLHFPSNNVAVNFSNTAVFATWPVAFGYNNTDPFGGASTGTVSSTLSGFINLNASGTGTVVMPGGTTLSNCLQVVVTLTVNQTAGTFSQTMVSKEYTYYHSSAKFPVLSYQYQTSTSGTTTTNSFNAFVNTAVVTGLSRNELSSNLSVYPNPAKEFLTVSLENNANDMVTYTISNMLGQEVKSANLGTNAKINSTINVAGLSKGIYMLNLKTGTATSVKKIIIE